MFGLHVPEDGCLLLNMAEDVVVRPRSLLLLEQCRTCGVVQFLSRDIWDIGVVRSLNLGREGVEVETCLQTLAP